MLDGLPLERLLAASYALPVQETLQDIADEVAGWDADGVAAKEIDRRIRKWGEENGLGRESFVSEFLEENPGFQEQFPGLDVGRVWQAFKYDEWLVDCVRSLAFTDEPVAFHPLAAGFWYEIPDHDPPLLIGVMTPLSDPDLGAKQMKEKFKRFFGAKAARRTRKDEVERARMLARRRQGMTLREIAMQNLRDRYPDIIHRPAKYKKELDAEKSRVAKSLPVTDEVWRKRIPDSSTEE
jgi:hypothetical protein